MFDNVFENRGQWQKWSGAESSVPECSGRRVHQDQLQLLRRNDHLTLAATESWRRHCLLVYTELTNEEGRKKKCQNKHKGASQLPAHHSFSAQRLCHLLLCYETQCSPSIWSLYPNSKAEASFLLILVFPELSVSILGQMM